MDKRLKIALIAGAVVVVVAIVAVSGYKEYCNELVPKDVTVKYTEQEPYVIYETQTRIMHVKESHCDENVECDCTGRFLLIGTCTSCDCEVTSKVPVTKYRQVEKTRVETQMVKRCN